MTLYYDLNVKKNFLQLAKNKAHEKLPIKTKGYKDINEEYNIMECF